MQNGNLGSNRNCKPLHSQSNSSAGDSTLRQTASVVGGNSESARHHAHKPIQAAGLKRRHSVQSRLDSTSVGHALYGGKAHVEDHRGSRKQYRHRDLL